MLRKLTLLVWLATLQVPGFAAEPHANATIVDQFINAYNQRDAEAMGALSASGIRFMSIAGDQVETWLEGRDSIAATLASATPGSSSVVVDTSVNGKFVTVTEKAIWNEGQSSQCAVSVYEIESEKILNVWYFDAQPC